MMFGLQEYFHNLSDELYRPATIIFQCIKSRFDDLGICLTSDQISQLDSISKDVVEEGVLEINFNFESDQLKNAGFNNEEEIEPFIQQIFDELNEDIDAYLKELDQDTYETLTKIVDDIAPMVLESLNINASEMLSNNRSADKEFTELIEAKWGNALNKLEMFLVISQEAVEYVNDEYGKSINPEGDLVLETLIRLHARACQISREIITLLRHGFADGAHARWRSLHEIAVVGIFLAEGNEELSERYVLHEDIESYKAALQYRKYSEELGLDEIDDQEFEEVKEIRDKLIDRFGKEFNGDYGWAAAALNNKRPNFSDIESAISLDHYRPYYKLASHNVHANAKGLFVKLGLREDSRDILLADSSDYGLTEPGHSMALSLGILTVQVLTHNSTVDLFVISKMIKQLSDEIGDEFSEIEISENNN